MKKIMAVTALALALVATGCSKSADNTVLAKVGRAKITTADFKRQLEDLPPKLQQAVMTDAQARKDFLDDLIGIEVVLQEAKRRGMDKDSEFTKKQETLKKEMERRLQEETRNELFNSLLKKELLGKVMPPTDQEVKEYYKTHRDEIRKASGGKDLTLKEAEARGLKAWLYQKRQRDAYLEYARGLRKNVKVDIDEKALEAAVVSLSQPPAEKNPKMPAPPVSGDTGTKK